MKKSRLIFSVLLLIGLAGCATPGSKLFEPESREGKAAYSHARKDIYPQQVRENPERYANDTVVWAGIVKNVELFQSQYGPALMVRIAHHYFDWIEDHGAQPEVFFLSPRGEGDFMIILKPNRGMTQKEANESVPAGTMVVAVGKIYVKMAKNNNTMPLPLVEEYFQFIDRKWYRTDVFDYGRDKEPIKKVEGSKFWKGNN